MHEIIGFGMSSLSQFMQLMHAWVDQSSVKKQKMPSMGNRTAYKFGNVKVCDLSDVYGAVLKKNSACKYWVFIRVGTHT